MYRAIGRVCVRHLPSPQHEWSAGMDMCVNRLLIEGEHERKEQEKREKQQAEQIAASKTL